MREREWRCWAWEVDRRIREFEGLVGEERRRGERGFVEWVRMGEGLWMEDGRWDRGDEESAIGPAMTDEEFARSWRGGSGEEEGWEMAGSAADLRDLHMTVAWSENADAQARAHREAQERARMEEQERNDVLSMQAAFDTSVVMTATAMATAEASSQTQNAGEGSKQVRKAVKETMREVDQMIKEEQIEGDLGEGEEKGDDASRIIVQDQAGTIVSEESCFHSHHSES